jgi:four helix bundle protein
VENIRGFRDLKVWQKAMDAAMRVFDVSEQFPKREVYSLTDQIRRSSRSVPSNIAEAWRKRRYPAAFVSKLSDAEGEAAETQTHIEMALRCGYLTTDQAKSLDAAYEEVLAMLVTMAAHPDQWTIRRP